MGFFNWYESCRHFTHRSVQSISPPALSSPFGGLPQLRRQYHHESTRGKECNRAIADQFEISLLIQKPVCGLCHRAERYAPIAGKAQRKFPTKFSFHRASGKFSSDVVYKKMVKLLQRLDQQEIHREPNRPAPVRISAEQTTGRFGGLVIDLIRSSIGGKRKRLVPVNSRKSSNSMLG